MYISLEKKSVSLEKSGCGQKRHNRSTQLQFTSCSLYNLQVREMPLYTIDLKDIFTPQYLVSIIKYQRQSTFRKSCNQSTSQITGYQTRIYYFSKENINGEDFVRSLLIRTLYPQGVPSTLPFPNLDAFRLCFFFNCHEIK